MKTMTIAVALALAGCAATPRHTSPDYERAARAPLPLTPIGNIQPAPCAS